LSYASFTLFPSDANGYPVVGPDPFSIWPEGAILRDGRPGNDGWIESWERLVTFVFPIEPSGPPGDFNHDGIVDAADYVVWRKSPGNFGGDPSGYNTWRANFGQTSGSGTALPSPEPLSTGVPEPASLALLTLGVPALLLRRRSEAVKDRWRLLITLDTAAAAARFNQTTRPQDRKPARGR
jgi:hypothetical protein